MQGSLYVSLLHAQVLGVTCVGLVKQSLPGQHCSQFW